MTHQNADDKQRWFLLVTVILNLFLSSSISLNAGMVNIAAIEHFGASEVITSWIFAIYGFMFALAAPIAHFVMCATSCRVCIVSGGLVTCVGYVLSSLVKSVYWLFPTLVLTGIGQSMTFLGATVPLGYYFPTLTAAAFGASMLGMGLGNVVHPVLFTAMKDVFGFHGALLLSGAIASHSCAFGLLIHSSKLEIEAKSKRIEEKGSVLKVFQQDAINQIVVLKYPLFSLAVLAIFVYSVGLAMVLIILPQYYKEKLGLSDEVTSVVVAVQGGCATFGRLLVGLAASETQIGTKLMFVGLNFVSAIISVLAEPILTLPGGHFVLSIAFGIYCIPLQSLLFSLSVALIGLERAAAGYSVILLVFGIGGLAGPPLGAQLSEVFGHDIIFLLTGILFLSSSGLGALASILHDLHTPKSQLADGIELEKVDKDNEENRGKNSPAQEDLFYQIAVEDSCIGGEPSMGAAGKVASDLTRGPHTTDRGDEGQGQSNGFKNDGKPFTITGHKPADHKLGREEMEMKVKTPIESEECSNWVSHL